MFAVDCVWNVMAHAQKPDFVFRRNGRVHLNRRGSQFSRLLAAEMCASAVVMLDTPCSEVVRRVLAIHSIRQFPLHFPSRASPCAVTFQLDSTIRGYSTVSNSVVEEKLNNVIWIPEAFAWSRRRYSLFCRSMSLFSVVISGVFGVCAMMQPTQCVFPIISSTQSYWRRLTVQNRVVDLSSLCCKTQTSSERCMVETWPVKLQLCMVLPLGG
jgi:hypothetical protein